MSETCRPHNGITTSPHGYGLAEHPVRACGRGCLSRAVAHAAVAAPHASCCGCGADGLARRWRRPRRVPQYRGSLILCRCLIPSCQSVHAHKPVQLLLRAHATLVPLPHAPLSRAVTVCIQTKAGTGVCQMKYTTNVLHLAHDGVGGMQGGRVSRGANGAVEFYMTK